MLRTSNPDNVIEKIVERPILTDITRQIRRRRIQSRKSNNKHVKIAIGGKASGTTSFLAIEICCIHSEDPSRRRIHTEDSIRTNVLTKERYINTNMPYPYQRFDPNERVNYRTVYQYEYAVSILKSRAELDKNTKRYNNKNLPYPNC